MAEYSPDVQCITFVCWPKRTNSVEAITAVWLKVPRVSSLHVEHILLMCGVQLMQYLLVCCHILIGLCHIRIGL